MVSHSPRSGEWLGSCSRYQVDWITKWLRQSGGELWRCQLVAAGNERDRGTDARCRAREREGRALGVARDRRTVEPAQHGEFRVGRRPKCLEGDEHVHRCLRTYSGSAWAPIVPGLGDESAEPGTVPAVHTMKVLFCRQVRLAARHGTAPQYADSSSVRARIER